MSDVTFHMEENRMEVHNKSVEPWKVTVVDTGEEVAKSALNVGKNLVEGVGDAANKAAQKIQGFYRGKSNK